MNHYHLKSGQISDIKVAMMLQKELNANTEYDFYIVMHDTEHQNEEEEIS